MTPSVTLTPATDDLLPALRALSVAPEHQDFSGQPAEVLARDESDVTCHAILAGGVPVGLFRLDADFSRWGHDFAPDGSLGLRSMIVDRAHQGRGIGTATIRALPGYLARLFPQAREIYLTVNLRNPAARASYLSGGFEDTGAQYLDGGFGPQHILRMPL